MRRLMAILSALALVAVLAGSTVAKAPPVGATGFAGSFDVVINGQKLGHVSALLRVPVGKTSVAGHYSFMAADGSSGDQAVLSAPMYYRGTDRNEVWFKGFSVGWPADPATGPGYAMWIGHFVDVLDPAGVDYFEVSGQALDIDFVDGGYPVSVITTGGQFTNRFDVGRGTFVLRVPASCGNPC
jgi:hypothetical protein